MKKKISIVSFIAIILSIYIFTGCASTIKLTKKDKNSVNNVFIKFSLPETIYFYGKTQECSMFFGAVGGAIGAAFAEGTSGEIQSLVYANNISIAAIVANEFEAQFKKNNFFSITKLRNYDAELKIKIKSYGLQVKHLFSSQYKPILKINAKIIKNGGRVIWEDNYSITAGNSETPSYTYGEYFQNPNKLKHVWMVAASLSVTKFLDTM